MFQLLTDYAPTDHYYPLSLLLISNNCIYLMQANSALLAYIKQLQLIIISSIRRKLGQGRFLILCKFYKWQILQMKPPEVVLNL